MKLGLENGLGAANGFFFGDIVRELFVLSLIHLEMSTVDV